MKRRQHCYSYGLSEQAVIVKYIFWMPIGLILYRELSRTDITDIRRHCYTDFCLKPQQIDYLIFKFDHAVWIFPDREYDTVFG